MPKSRRDKKAPDKVGLFLPDHPSDQQILAWLEQHDLPERCLDAVKGWIEACENDSVVFRQGFAISITCLAVNNCALDYDVATELEERLLNFSNYTG